MCLKIVDIWSPGEILDPENFQAEKMFKTNFFTSVLGHFKTFLTTNFVRIALRLENFT